MSALLYLYVPRFGRGPQPSQRHKPWDSAIFTPVVPSQRHNKALLTRSLVAHGSFGCDGVVTAGGAKKPDKLNTCDGVTAPASSRDGGYGNG
jgi:hypothetical protein